MSNPRHLNLVPEASWADTIEKLGGGSGSGGGMSDNLEKRVERLETDLSAVRVDLAILKERSENFATKAELATLIERSENFATKADLEKAIGSVGNKITWSIFVPLLIAVLGWLAKELFFK